MTPETKFKTKLREGFAEFYKGQPTFYFAIVASMMQKAGVPDIFVAAEKVSAWVEAKANGDWLRPTQKIVIPQMVAAGLRCCIIHTDMRVDRKERTIQYSDFKDGKLQEDRVMFKWADLNNHLFWRTVLGIYA